MSLQEAQNFLNPNASLGESSTTGGYVQPKDIKDAIGVIYTDFSPVTDDPAAWVSDALYGGGQSFSEGLRSDTLATLNETLGNSLDEALADLGAKFGDSTNALNTGPQIEAGSVGQMDGDDIAEVKLRVMEYVRDYTSELIESIKTAIDNETSP